MRRLLEICILAATLPFAACDVFDPDADEAIEELRENRQKWRQAASPSYSYVLQRQCFCGTEMTRPVRITVVNGVFESARYVETGEAVRSDWLQFFPTMEGLFDLLEREIRDADEIEITYDAARGFPVHAEIDQIERAIDDEYVLDITHVNP